MAGESLTFELFGVDVSASDALRDLAREADRTSRALGDIRVQVTGEDALADLRRELDRLPQDTSIRIRVETDGGDIAGLRRELETLRSQSVDVRVRVDGAADVAALRRELATISSQSVSVRVRVGGAAQVATLRRDLAQLDGRTATVRVRVDGADDAYRDLAQLDWALNQLQYGHGGSAVVLHIDIDIDSIDEVRELNDLLDRLDRDRDITIRTRVSGDQDVSRLGEALGGIGGRAMEAGRAALAFAGHVAGMASAAIAAIPVVTQAATAVAAVGSAAVAASPALAAWAVAGGVVRAAMQGIFADGNKLRETLQPIADGFTLAGQNASIAASAGIAPLAKEFGSTVWPEINHTFVQIGKSVGNVVRGFLEWAESARGVALIKNTLTPIWQAFDDLEQPVLRVSIAFVEMLARIERVSLAGGTAGLAGVLDRIAAAMDKVDAKTITEAFGKLRDVWDAVHSAGSRVVSVVEAATRAYQDHRTEIGLLGDALAVVAIAFGGPTGAITGSLALITRHFGGLKDAYDDANRELSKPSGLTNYAATNDIGDENSGLVGTLVTLGKAFGAVKTQYDAFRTALATPSGMNNAGATNDLRDEDVNRWKAFIGNIQTAYQTVLPAFKKAWDDIKTSVGPAIEEIWTKITTQLIPALGRFVEAAAPIVKWFTETIGGPVIKQALDSVLAVFSGFITLLTGILDTASAIIHGDWEALIHGLIEIAQGFGQIIGGIFELAFQLLVAQFTLLGSALLAGLEAGWNLLVDGVTGLIRRFVDAVKGALGIASPSTVFIQIGSDIVAGLLQGLVSAWEAVTSWFVGIVTTITGYFVGAATWLLQAGADLIGGLVQGLTAGWEAVSAWFVNVTTVVIPGFFAAAGSWLLQAGSDILNGLLQGLTTGWNAVSNWFVTTTTVTIPGFFASAGSWLVDGGQRIITGLWDGLKAIWESVSSWFVQITTSTIPGFFASAGSWLVDGGQRIIQGLWDGLKAAWSSVAGWFGSLPGLVEGYFADAGSWLFGAGQRIIGGLIDGIRSMAGSVASAISGIAGSIGGFFPGSPVKWGPLSGSGEPAQRGGRIALGIAAGITRQAGSVRDAVAGLAGGSFAGFGAGALVATAGGAAFGGVGVRGAGGPTVNVYLTVQGSVLGERDFATRIAPTVRDAIYNNSGSNGRRTGLPAGR